MAEIEPSKIWASTGIIVAAIFGMTAVQIRSTGSVSTEIPDFSNVSSASQSPAASSPSPSSGSTTYEMSYLGSGSKYIPLSFRTNPLSLPTARGYDNARRPLSAPAIDEDDELESDVAQELLKPEFSEIDVAATIGDAPEGEMLTADLTSRAAEPESLLTADLNSRVEDSSRSLVELTRQVVQLDDFQVPASDGPSDYSTMGDGEPPMVMEADNIDYTKTGFMLDGNVRVTRDGSSLGYAYNPQQAQQLYFANVITGSVSPQQAQTLAYQQAVAQFAPQNSDQVQAMAAEQAIVQQQQPGYGQQSLIDQRIQANLVARAQYETGVQQASHSLSKEMIYEVRLTEH